jgi:hypothetical protein
MRASSARSKPTWFGRELNDGRAGNATIQLGALEADLVRPGTE